MSVSCGRSVIFFGFLHNKTDRYENPTIFLKLALNTITLPNPYYRCFDVFIYVCITFVDTNIFQTEEVECQDLDKLQQADDEMMTTMTTRVDIGGEGGILLEIKNCLISQRIWIITLHSWRFSHWQRNSNGNYKKSD